MRPGQARPHPHAARLVGRGTPTLHGWWAEALTASSRALIPRPARLRNTHVANLGGACSVNNFARLEKSQSLQVGQVRSAPEDLRCPPSAPLPPSPTKRRGPGRCRSGGAHCAPKRPHA